jgi:hypothetical protein
MRIKVVYVLCCSGQDTYYEEFLLSYKSLVLHNPGIKVEVIMDPDSYEYVLGKRERLLDDVTMSRVPVPDQDKGGVWKSRYLKTNLRSIVKGDFLYMDTDTLIARPLSDIDDIEADVAAVINGNGQAGFVSVIDRYYVNLAGLDEIRGPYFNGGVFLSRDTEVSHAFFRAWHARWLRQVNGGGPCIDQPALFKTNLEAGRIIRELPGEWNVQTAWDESACIFSKARIIHYYASEHLFAKRFIIPHIQNAGGTLDDAAVELAMDPLKPGLMAYRVNSLKGIFLMPYSRLLYSLRKCPRLFLGISGVAAAFAKIVFSLTTKKTIDKK